MIETTPFWTTHADRRPFLLGRARITAALRQFFAARDFVEVETGTLGVSPGNETHLHAFASDLVTPAGERVPFYLRTSPEFACKKLLAAGEPRIVEFARVVPQPRARRLAPSGIHPGRVVSGSRAVRGADGRLRGDPGVGGARHGCRAVRLSWREHRPVCAARAAHRRRRICPLCRHRSRGAAGERRRPVRSRRRRSASACASPPTTPGAMSSAGCWSRRSSRGSGRGGRPSSTNIRSCSRRWPGRPMPIRAWRSASSSMPAASNSPTASAN